MFVVNPAASLTENYGINFADAQVFDNTAMLRSMQLGQQARARGEIAKEKQRQEYAEKVDKQIAGLGDKVFERDEASFQQQATDMYNWSVENSNKLREGNPAILAEWNNKVSQFHREAAISNQIGKEYYKEKAVSDNERLRHGTSYYPDTDKPWDEFASDAHVRDYNLPKGRERVTSLFDWHTKSILPQKTKWMADTQKGESEITPDDARLMIDNAWNENSAQIARRELGNPEIATPEYLQKIGYTVEESKHPDEIIPKDYAEKKLLEVTTGKRTPRPMVGRGGSSIGGKKTTYATYDPKTNKATFTTKAGGVSSVRYTQNDGTFGVAGISSLVVDYNEDKTDITGGTGVTVYTEDQKVARTINKEHKKAYDIEVLEVTKERNKMGYNKPMPKVGMLESESSVKEKYEERKTKIENMYPMPDIYDARYEITELPPETIKVSREDALSYAQEQGQGLKLEELPKGKQVGVNVKRIEEEKVKGAGTEKQYIIKGKSYPESKVAEKAKASGVSIEDYLIEVNKP